MHLTAMRAAAIVGVQQLAHVDYAVANRVTDEVARVVVWSYAHDFPWLARVSVHCLQTFDLLGGILISLVVWLVDHTP